MNNYKFVKFEKLKRKNINIKEHEKEAIISLKKAGWTYSMIERFLKLNISASTINKIFLKKR